MLGHVASIYFEHYLYQFTEEFLCEIDEKIQDMIKYMDTHSEEYKIPGKLHIEDFETHKFGTIYDYAQPTMCDKEYTLYLNNSLSGSGNAITFDIDGTPFEIGYYWSILTEDHWNKIPDNKKTAKGECKYYLSDGNDNKIISIPVFISNDI